MQNSFFLTLIKFNWELLKAYPVRFFTVLFWIFFGFIPQYFFWKIIIANSNSIPYTFKEIAIYMLITWTLHYSLNYINRHFNEISNGGVVTQIIKPISLTNYYFKLFFSEIFITKISTLIFTIIIGTIFLGIKNTALGILFYILGMSIGMLVYTILFFSMFWLRNNWGLKFSFDIIMMFAAGLWIPLDLLPKTASTILHILPFNLMFYTPVKIFLGQLQINYILILQYIVWIAILYFSARFLEYYGLKHYEQLGG